MPLKLAPVGAFVFAIGACAEQSPTEVQLEPGTAAQSITAAKTLQVYPGKYTLDIGQVKQFVAIPRDSKGRTVSITSAKEGEMEVHASGARFNDAANNDAARMGGYALLNLSAAWTPRPGWRCGPTPQWQRRSRGRGWTRWPR